MTGRTSRALLRSATAAVATLLLAACGGGGDGFVNPPTTIPPITISINPATATVNVGATTSLSVSISGGSPTPTLASCTSSSPTTAAVTVSGVSCVVVGVSPGTATITATTSSGVTASAVITVAALPAAVTELTLTPATASLTVGQTTPLTATPTSPAGASVAVAFSSSSVGVASVSVAGVVTAVSPGTATITATAVGTGVGFTPATISRTAVITVTADPCTPIPVTLPINLSRTVSASSCQISPNSSRRGLVLEFNLPSAAALELLMTPSNFAPYMTVFPQGEPDFIFRSRDTPDPVSGIWHLPSGPTELRVGTLNAGAFGSFQIGAQQVSASVENCRSVVVGGSVTSNQALQNTDCLLDGFQHDAFLIYSTRPCVITMNRATAGASMADPFLEVYNASDLSLVADDDDSGGNLNARIQLASCSAANGNEVIEVRATSVARGDLGAYSFGVVFLDPAEGATVSGSSADHSAQVAAPAIEKAPRERVAPRAEPGRWLRHLGIGVESRAE